MRKRVDMMCRNVKSRYEKRRYDVKCRYDAKCRYDVTCRYDAKSPSVT
jgi:hypothetical protein